ncbi:MAG: site-specific integrase [Rhizobiales bacterium]|nr:site-specific integrase [Hyphomicrobiales bacterium]
MPLKVVKRHGSPHLYLRGTVRGIVVDESTRTDDKEAAEAIRISREAELLNRSVFGRRATATFLEAAVIYMEAGGESTYVGKLVDHFGTLQLQSIGQLEIDQAARKLYPNAAPATLNRQVYTPISAILKKAAKAKLVEFFPISRPKEPEGRVRYLTPGEADKLIKACAPHMAPLVVFLLYTGARVSEALYLDWKQLDLKRAHVSFLETKSGPARGVPLHGRAVAALANIEHREGPVFLTDEGLPYAPKDDGGGQIKTGFAGACRRAGIEDFHPHDCRHTWATWHYAANRDLGGLMKLGGWKSERMVLRYAHVNVGHLAGSIAALPWGKSGEPKKRRRKAAKKAKG